MDVLVGDKFANFVLYQQQVEEPQEVSSVSVDKPRNTGGKRGGKLSYTLMMMLSLLTFCYLMGPAAATPVQAAILVSANTGISFVSTLIFMLVIVGSSVGVSNRSAQPVYAADKPMTCRSSAIAKPSIHPINHQYKCESAPSSEGKYMPTPVKTTVYLDNFIEWRSKAYQCMKTR